jgi:hypothetical protein
MIPLLLSCFHKNKEKRNVVIFSFAYQSQNDVKTRLLSKNHKTWDQTLATIDFGWFLSLIHYNFPSSCTHLLFHHLHLVLAKS